MTVKSGEDAVPEASLRARKKAAAMRLIQSTAMDAFERDGFDAVTIEQIAQASDVSPSTVYRYFGTKEGLVLHDDTDDGAMRDLVERVASGEDPAVALRSVLSGLFETRLDPSTLDLAVRRTRLWLGSPSVYRAGLVMYDEAVEGIAVALSQVSDASLAQTRLAVAATCAPMLQAIRNWHDAGAAPGAMYEHLEQALQYVPERIPGWPNP